MKERRVVITGLGAITPLGNDVPTTWEALLKGKSGAAAITEFDATQCKTHFACEVKNFDCSSLIDHKTAHRMDRYAQLAVCSADEALRDAAINIDASNASRIGVIWGGGMGGLISFEEGWRAFVEGDGVPNFSPFYIPKALISMGAGHISLFFGLKGPSFAVTSACASSSHAIIEALDTIRLGRADMMVTGGSDADVTFSGIGGFNALRALSTRNDSPETASRPFSASRDGFVLAEGGVALVLEEYEHAKARGAKIYAELVGAGMTSDAYHMTAPDPNGTEAEHVMRLAMEDAGISSLQVDYINTHGTSTQLGDLAEVNAILRVFGEDAYRINLDSTKSMTGHMLGASGAMEALACALAVHHGIVPPTINHDENDLDEHIDYRLNFTFGKAQKRDIRYALSNSFGFGGHNACLAFAKI